MKTLLALTILTFLLTTPQVKANDLSLEQKAILKLAAMDQLYSIKTVDTVFESRHVTVVLFGETHVKDAVTSQIGKEVLKYFSFRGFEGVEKADLEYPAIAEVIRQITQTQVQLRQDKHLKGSTIYDATSSGYAFRADGEVYLNTRLIGQYESNTAFTGDYSSGLSKLAQKVALARQTVDPQNLNLKLAPGYEKFKYPENVPVNIGLEYSPLTKWDEACRPHCSVMDTILDVRNARMIANIHSILHAFPEQKTLFLIVGAAHLPGLIKLL
jgi:hypothetical protein